MNEVGKLNTPLRRFPAYPKYKDSGVEWLEETPAHWEVRRLKRVCTLAYGESLSSGIRLDGDVEVYGSNGPVGFHDQANTLAPCLVIGRKGSFGKVNFSSRPVFTIDTTFFVDHRFTRADIRWLYYVLTHARLDAATKDSAIPGLDREDAYARDVCVCSPEEQRAIAAFLDRETAKIDALVAKKERLIELLQEKRAAVITHAVTKGLPAAAAAQAGLPSTDSGQATLTVPMKDSGVEWLGEIPAHWEVRRIKFFTTYVTSGSRGWAGYYSDDGAIFLRIGNLTRTGIDLDLKDLQRVTPPPGAEVERTRVRKNDVLISITAYIGSVAVVNDELDTYVNQHIALTRPVLNHVSPRWVAYSFLSVIGKSQFQQLLYGGTKDGLGLDDVRNLIALLPPLKEQSAIVEFLDRESDKIDSLIAKVREGIEKLKEYRSALISAAVTGKVDVRGEMSL